MKRSLLLIAMLAMIFTFQDAQSQSLRRMVKQKILNDNLEAQAKRDSVKAVEEGREPDKTPNTTMDRVYMDALGLTDNVAHETAYDFDAYIQMELTDYKKNGKLDEKVVYDNYLHKKDADYAMVFKDEDDKSTIIFDTKNSAMLILADADGEQTGFATTIDPEAIAEMAEDYNEDYEEDYAVVPPNIKKTGKTKTILGYKCDEYLVEEEESEVHMWISEKLGKEMRKEWMNNQQTFGGMFTHAYAVNGMALEYEMIEKNGEKSTMLVTKIDLNHSHKISTKGYNIISMRQKTGEE